MYLRPERLTQDLTTLRLLNGWVEVIRGIAEQLLPATQQAVALRFLVDVVALQSQIGQARCQWSAYHRPDSHWRLRRRKVRDVHSKNSAPRYVVSSCR